MKIDKLYTLSQFILLIKEKVINEGLDFAMALSLIFRYLEFLLQPLTKEMFVNEFEVYKNDPKTSACLPENINKNIESEKKVIFETEQEITINPGENIKNSMGKVIKYI